MYPIFKEKTKFTRMKDLTSLIFPGIILVSSGIYSCSTPKTSSEAYMEISEKRDKERKEYLKNWLKEERTKDKK